MTATSSGVEGTSAGLVERAAHGDGDAFDAIARALGDALYRRALAILRHESDAQDATQDAFIKAWRELPRLNDHSRFDAWLDRILVNACRDQLRRRGRQQLREIHPAVGDRPTTQVSQTDPDDDRRTAIEAAFRRLGIEDRTLLVLHHLEQRTVADLAAALAIPTGTAKWRLHNARRRLERELDKEDQS
jgi:RNA polymerase sigma-70 factor (ECF subfamily)